jgi:hypothetical protein
MAQTLAYGGLGATTLAILEVNPGLTSKALASRLRAAGLTVQNIEIIHELLRLTKEGRVIKVQGPDKEVHYYKKEARGPNSASTSSP